MGCAIDWSPFIVKKPFYWEFKIDLELRQSPNCSLITESNQSQELHNLQKKLGGHGLCLMGETSLKFCKRPRASNRSLLMQ